MKNVAARLILGLICVATALRAQFTNATLDGTLTINASSIVGSSIFPPTMLGSGIPSSATILYGNGTWNLPPPGNLPSQAGNSGLFLTTNGTLPFWASALGTTGSSVNNGIATYNGTGGNAIRSTPATVDQSGNATFPALLTLSAFSTGGVLVNNTAGLVSSQAATSTLMGYLGTGSASTSTYLRGDGSWQPISLITNLSSNGNLLLFQSGAADATPTPRAGVIFQLESPATQGSAIEMESWQDGNAFIGRRANGVPGSPTAVNNGDFLSAIVGNGFDGTSYATFDAATVQLQAIQNWTSSAHGADIVMNVTQLNHTSEATAMVINSDGALGSQFFGVIHPTSTIGIAGTVTNDLPQIGSLGEILTATSLPYGYATLNVTFGTPVTLSSSVVANIGNFQLTPGRWRIFGKVNLLLTTGTALSGFYYGCAITNSDLNGDIPTSTNGGPMFVTTQTFNNTLAGNINVFEVFVPAGPNLIVYVNALCYFSGGTAKVGSTVWAERAL